MKVRTILIVGAIAAVVGGTYAWREYNRAPAGAASMAVKETVSAEQLFTAFSADESAASATFVGTSEQVIEVTGKIRSIDPGEKERVDVILETGDVMAGVVCEFEQGSVPPSWKPGDQVKVKGICTGMLLDIILIRCVAAE